VLNTNNVKEVWVPILDFEKRYEISNLGNVRSIQDNHHNYRIKNITNYLRSRTCKYLYVQLWRKDKPVTKAIHRLVAIAFVPNPHNKPQVNHKDGVKINNTVDLNDLLGPGTNIEWATCSENHKHAWATGLKDRDKHTKRMIGTKFNAASNYKNVSWDSSRNRWIGGVKHKGKVIKNKRFKTEIEAALHVNWIIDTYGLDRPKNIIS